MHVTYPSFHFVLHKRKLEPELSSQTLARQTPNRVTLRECIVFEAASS